MRRDLAYPYLNEVNVPRTIEIPFASPKHALIAKQVIEVDPELQPHAVKRQLAVEDEKLIAYAWLRGLFLF